MSSHDGHKAYKLVRQLKTVVGAELEFAFVAEDEVSLPLQRHLKSCFASSSSITESEIEEWLNNTSFYDPVSKRWTCMLENTTADSENTLYEPMVRILNAVISEFGHSEKCDASGKTIQRRLAKDTHRYPASPLQTYPDVCILASGGCITDDPAISKDLSYAQVAELEIYDSKLDIPLLELYAREVLVFIHQMNRNFVRVNIFTDNYLRVLQFDRAGCFYSQLIDYHSNPMFFIRLILLGSSFNEACVGFDRSIVWDNGRRKLKMKPNQLLSSREWVDNIDETSYEFDVDPIPIFAHLFIIKTYWRGEGRICESQFLRDFVGIKGIPQMLAFEDGVETIKTLRGLQTTEDMIADCKSPRVVFNRTLTRIVIPEYGGTLEQATCAHQFVCAVRDIVVAHRIIATSLPEEKRVLHADISPANLRLAHGEGESGVLIDFDLAKRIHDLVDGHESAETEAWTGTPRYHSIQVHLRNQPGLSHRQPIDDLESIYYVICEALYGYDENATQIPELPFGSEWLRSLTANEKELASFKTAFLYLPLWRVRRFPADADVVVLKQMMNDLHSMFREHTQALHQLMVAHEPEEDSGIVPDPPAYKLATTLDVYERFLRAIDEAIVKLDDAGPYLRPPTDAPPVESPP
uniref:Other/FunK1 protein kinase n=1 Tax=Mycena chlorophos TaxID=658473 RepID=A0ABQ0LYH7_MYCCL|nr:other/FunK1 protein kinase [Mycena chlorophos]